MRACRSPDVYQRPGVALAYRLGVLLQGVRLRDEEERRLTPLRGTPFVFVAKANAARGASVSASAQAGASLVWRRP